MMGEIPPCNIRIDKEGNWYYKEAPIIREDIYLLFNQHIVRGSDGRYLLHIGNEKCYLEVDDTPFVIKRVSLRADFKILLNDATQETLRLDTLRVGTDNILYCKVKDGEFDARFSRPSYYQFAEHIAYDEVEDRYFIPLDEKRYYLEWTYG